jgi:hypothetical protein
MGSAGAYGSPGLSASDLMRRWPATDHRREIVMVTDGIDRSGRNANNLWRGLHLNPDVDTASSNRDMVDARLDYDGLTWAWFDRFFKRR